MDAFMRVLVDPTIGAFLVMILWLVPYSLLFAAHVLFVRWLFRIGEIHALLTEIRDLLLLREEPVQNPAFQFPDSHPEPSTQQNIPSIEN